jgi:uncharacterized membrane protein
MERGLYAHMLEPEMPAADWRRALRDAYMETAVLLPFWQAFLIRIKRIYSYLVLATYLGWLFKVVSVVEATGAPMPWPVVAIVSAIVFPVSSYAIFVHGEHRLDV